MKIRESRNCPNCNKIFEVIGTKSQFSRGKVKRFCSRSCSNKRIFNDSIKSKISESLKKSPIRFQPNPIGKKKIYEFICCGCGEIGHDRRYRKNRKYHLDCWIKVSGGVRKGSSRGKCGWYKGFWCDSSYELAFLIYCMENEIKIERNKIGFEYYYKNKRHLFYPDFIVNDKYVEIKNFKSNLTDAKLKYFPYDINVIYRDGIKKYLDYAIDKYGKNFINLYGHLA